MARHGSTLLIWNTHVDDLLTGPDTSLFTWLQDRHAYTLATNEAELRPLADLGLAVLVKRTGETFSIAAILDARGTNAAPLDAIEETARQCARALSSRTRQVRLRVVKFGDGAVNVVDIDRLLGVGRVGFGKPGAVTTWLVDTGSARTYSNEAGLGRDEFRALQGWLSKRHHTAQVVGMQAQAVGLPVPLSPPLFTGVLLALLIGVYLAEVVFSRGANFVTGPGPDLLVAMGGTSSSLLLSGDLWRLTTAPLLHGGPLHLLSNCLGLLLIGPVLEKWVGTRWISTIFVISAVFGSLTSAIVNPPLTVGVGASGGLVGLLAAALLVASAMPNGRDRAVLISRAVCTLIPTVFPFFQGRPVVTDGAVDYAAHLGGGVAGAVICFALMQLRKREMFSRALKIASAAVPVAFFAVALMSTVPIASWVGSAHLVDFGDLADDTNWANELDARLEQFPRDPSLRYLLARRHIQRGELNAGLAALEAALAEELLLRRYFSPELRQAIVVWKAVILVAKGQTE